MEVDRAIDSRPEAFRATAALFYSKREILDAIFYAVRSGCAWRLLPNDLPPWRIVYCYFMVWRRAGLWQKIHDTLRDAV